MASYTPPPPTSGEFVVKVTFSKLQGQDDLEQRTVELKPQDELGIGRASSDSNRKMVANGDNLWLTSPVISRQHSRLSCKLRNDRPVIYVSDEGSSHGTYIYRRSSPTSDISGNGTRVYDAVEVEDGDILRFGERVSRAQSRLRFKDRWDLELTNEDTFDPPKFRIAIQVEEATKSLPSPPESKSRLMSRGTYNVPDFDADFEDEIILEDEDDDEEQEQEEDEDDDDEEIEMEMELEDEDEDEEDDDEEQEEQEDEQELITSEPEYSPPSYQDFSTAIMESSLPPGYINPVIATITPALPSPTSHKMALPHLLNTASQQGQKRNHDDFSQDLSWNSGFDNYEYPPALTSSLEQIPSSHQEEPQQHAQEHQTIDINENLNIHQTVEVIQPSPPGGATQPVATLPAPAAGSDDSERPRKRTRTGLIATGAFIGGLVGGAVSAVALLANLPEGFTSDLPNLFQ